MQTHVRLKALDRLGSLGYDQVTGVYINNYEQIGSCTIYKGADGSHFAILDIDDVIDLDMYVYYTNSNPYGMFWFNGLLLKSEPTKDKPSTQLKNIILKQNQK